MYTFRSQVQVTLDVAKGSNPKSIRTIINLTILEHTYFRF